MASSATAHSATISGTVNASGQSGVTYYFEYGPTTSYGTLTPAQPTSGNTNQNVNATLSGLNANTTYHYELVVKTSSGQLNKGGDQTFTTTSVAGGGTTSPATTTGRVTTASTTATTPRSTGYTTTPPPSTGYTTTPPPSTGYTTTPPPSTGYTTTPPPSTGYTTTPPSTSTHP
jgi:hypothetical protein